MNLYHSNTTKLTYKYIHNSVTLLVTLFINIEYLLCNLYIYIYIYIYIIIIEIVMLLNIIHY